jgi:hypothetical protein
MRTTTGVPTRESWVRAIGKLNATDYTVVAIVCTVQLLSFYYTQALKGN